MLTTHAGLHPVFVTFIFSQNVPVPWLHQFVASQFVAAAFSGLQSACYPSGQMQPGPRDILFPHSEARAMVTASV